MSDDEKKPLTGADLHALAAEEFALAAARLEAANKDNRAILSQIDRLKGYSDAIAGVKRATDGMRVCPVCLHSQCDCK